MAVAPALFHGVIIVERRERGHAAGARCPPAHNTTLLGDGLRRRTSSPRCVAPRALTSCHEEYCLRAARGGSNSASCADPQRDGRRSQRGVDGRDYESSRPPKRPPAPRQLWRCVSSNPASSCASDRCCSADRNMSENSISFSSITPPTLMVRTSSVPFGAK